MNGILDTKVGRRGGFSFYIGESNPLAIRMSYYYLESLSTDEFKRRSENALKKLEKKYQKKNEKPEPVSPKQPRSKDICRSWWGQVWSAYFEDYLVDCPRRLTRGKKYIRYGAVLDLKITQGQAKAVVMGQSTVGASLRNYQVTIGFDPLNEKQKQVMMKLFESNPAWVNQFLQGTFPPTLLYLVQKSRGLFPSPDEIHINCTCPDHNPVCKHVIAVMYGIGILFDQDPLLFFKLRGINPEDFIHKTIGNKIEAMLQKAQCQSDRILKKDAYELFDL